MLLSILTLMAIATLTTALTRTEMKSSSVVSVRRNHVLAGHAVSRQRAYDLLSCAHRCLADPLCMSFNFEDTPNGLCELNSQVAETTDMEKELLPKHGFVFGKLTNINVSMPFAAYECMALVYHSLKSLALRLVFSISDSFCAITENRSGQTF